MSPHPQALQNYRDRTLAEAGWYNLRQKKCERCKKQRSAAQYETHPTVCRTCRTGK